MRKVKNKVIWLLLFLFTFNLIPYKEGISVSASNDINIVSSTEITVSTAKQWARSKGATETFIGLADLYWKYAREHGNVNPAIAFVQAAKETGYGKFGGVINESYHNPCGLKTSQGGGDYDAEAHQRFTSWDQGVQAHLDHLALYAGASGYPRSTNPNDKNYTPDPRHFSSILGKAKTVQALGGAWAPSASYGTEILNLYNDLLKVQNTSKFYTVIDTPTNNMTVSGEKLSISGWALNSQGVSKVEVYLDNVFKTTAKIGLERKDVYNAYPEYSEVNSGYSASIDLKDITDGVHTIKIRQIGKNNNEDSAQVKINVVNHKPIQSIEEPANGATISKNTLRVSGWSLNDKGIDKIYVYVDDLKETSAKIGLLREDVGNAYPNYKDSKTSGYYADIDITNVSGGEKTIKVKQVARDGSTYITQTKVNINKQKAEPMLVLESFADGATITDNQLIVSGWSVNNYDIQAIKIYLDGKQVTTAQIGIKRPDVGAALKQYKNAGNSGFSGTVDLTNVAKGQRKIKVEQVASNGETYSVERTINVQKLPAQTVIDAPADNGKVGNSFSVSGWALNSSGVEEIKISIGEKVVATTKTGYDRPDVYNAFSKYGDRKSGYSINVSTQNISGGKQTLKVEQKGKDGTTHSSTRTIYVNKPNPITMIDAPSSSDNIITNSVNVSGWAVNASGVDTIKVYIGDQEVATTKTGLDRPDVYNVYPQYGDKKSGYSVNVDLSKVSNGNKVLKVVQTGKDGSKDSFEKTIKINKSAPMLSIEEPSNGANITSKSMVVSGWGLNLSGTESVKVYVNGIETTASIGLERKDVARVYPQYKDEKSGYRTSINIDQVKPGNNTVTVKLRGKDGTEISSSITINVQKKPAMTVLDAPAESSLVTNDVLDISGWALNDSGVKLIKVYLDGIQVASPAINISRPDVVAVFPGYINGNVCGYKANVNLNGLPKGEHKILVEAVGNDGTIETTTKTFFYKEKPGKLIVLDPGHNNGGDEGAEAVVNGVRYLERELNDAIALKTKVALEAEGHTVLFTRIPFTAEYASVSESLSKRVNLAESVNADLFVSIHQNKYDLSSANGTEVYYSTNNPDSGYKGPSNKNDKINKSKQLAASVCNSICNNGGFTNRGAKDGNLFVCRNTSMPSILIECGFISNPTDISKLSSSSGQDTIARAIANGLKSI